MREPKKPTIEQLEKRIEDLRKGLWHLVRHEQITHDLSWICGSILEDDDYQAANDDGSWQAATGKKE